MSVWDRLTDLERHYRPTREQFLCGNYSGTAGPSWVVEPGPLGFACVRKGYSLPGDPGDFLVGDAGELVHACTPCARQAGLGDPPVAAEPIAWWSETFLLGVWCGVVGASLVWALAEALLMKGGAA
jgi:hypothetical protein